MSRRVKLWATLSGAMMLTVGFASLTAAALATWRASDPAPIVETGAARLGDDVAVLVVAQQGAGEVAATARGDTLRWVLVALGVAVVPAMAIGWVASGRVLRTVDEMRDEIDAARSAADEDRRRRLDEVIHELRTPLAVAGTNLELAATDPSIAPDSARLIDAARRAAERMRRTVDDLAEHGQLSVSGVDLLDLGAEARAAVAEHAGPARARGLHIAARGVAQLPTGDRAAVRTALGNLVANSIRLAPSGSSIVVSCGEWADWAWVAVVDEGPGMPAQLHERVFERGWRGRHDRDRDREPHPAQRGLGLTITRQLTEAQGGLVTLESEEGAGSTFTLWFPVTDDAAETDVVRPDRLHPAVRPWHDEAVITA